MTTMTALPRPHAPSLLTSVDQILGRQTLPGHIVGSDTAIVWEGHTRTYDELRGRALRLATALRARGLNPGDRVAVHLLNRGELFETYFACAYAGLTFAPLSWRLTAYELASVLADCDPAVVITQESVAPAIADGAHALGLDPIVLGDDEPGRAYEALAGDAPFTGTFESADPHLLLYTSGTTGKPKGVMLTHANVTSLALQQLVMYPGITRGAVMLLNGPMYNTATINEHSIPTFMAGGTVAILPSRNWAPRRMADHIDRWQVTHTAIYPSMMDPLLEEDRRTGVGLETVRLVTTGAERCPPATIARFQARWPHAVLHLMYGSTECGLPTMIVGDEIGEHPGSIGRCTTGMSVQVRRPDGSVCAVDEAGELWVSGATVFAGYANAPETTAEVLRDGWLNTGDLARADAEGYLYLQGRTKDLIISKGQNIYPAEVEAVLAEHPALLDHAVVGLPDPEFGEVVCAAAVLKEGHEATEEDVIAFVRERLASYKKPRYVVFLETLPRNAGNKVVKAELTPLLLEHLAGR